MPKPGTPEWEEMVRYMRADLLSGFKYTKQVNTLIEMTRKLMTAQGKDFNKEFAKWLAEKHECTYIGPDESGLDEDIFVCNNCGAHAETIESISHHNTCKKGEAKKWEKFYEENSDTLWETAASDALSKHKQRG